MERSVAGTGGCEACGEMVCRPARRWPPGCGWPLTRAAVGQTGAGLHVCRGLVPVQRQMRNRSGELGDVGTAVGSYAAPVV